MISARPTSEALREVCISHDLPTRYLRRPPRDRGSVTVELVILAPVLLVLMLFVVFVGRASGATEQVRHAADEGARAASLVSRGSMWDAATAAVHSDLSTNGANCSRP